MFKKPQKADDFSSAFWCGENPLVVFGLSLRILSVVGVGF
jgi:hypothetical protein